MEIGGLEGLLYAFVMLLLPLVILAILLKILPPWKEMREEGKGSGKDLKEGEALGGAPAPGA
jgi:hypothetical protein